ncbi:hypothetical protein [Paenibacillus ginsengarvi]|uniref:Uncharacterized protein n=1 Tax=Paenibacillus ginsengarvi TaxID=400777 RepID=A0A3B0BM20_9BACL|nr:hypothetical protein [Paenibacillus ginsengarvi]RKN74202.1 hypothetical protein D7M11_27525 [Paenibacillus ginsengarvi]
MNRSKWLKWQIGAGAAAAVFFMFQTVRASPEFEQAHQMALASISGVPVAPTPRQPLLGGDSGRMGQSAPPGRSGGRQERRPVREDGGGGGQLSQPNMNNNNGTTTPSEQPQIRTRTRRS